MAHTAPELTRRAALAGSALLLPLPAAAQDAVTRAIGDLEKSSGARIGVAATDTRSGHTIGWRENERFLMCSTCKLLVAGAVLAKIDADQRLASRMIHYSQNDLLDFSAVTRKNLDQGMTLADLCAAAIVNSDNTAALLLVRDLGGPSAVTQFARYLGDATTRMDRVEPALNLRDGDLDTTTPLAMLADMKALLLGTALSPASRTLLTDWLQASTTGLKRLRSGLPPSWKTGDKTGSGAAGEANDIAISLPPGRPPILIAAYTEKGSDALLAQIGKTVALAFA